MKRFRALVIILAPLILLPGLSRAQAPSSGAKDAAEQILAVENDFQQAIERNDHLKIREFIDGDWIVIDPDGGIVSRESFLAAIENETLVHSSMVLIEPRVKIYGQTAVVTGRAESAGTYAGKPFQSTERATDVFVKDGDRWVCVLTQLTRIAPDAK